MSVLLAMENEIRLRLACDRCHSQKLRCSKRQGANVCDRCAKADAPCLFSPFRQKKDTEKKNNGVKVPVSTHSSRSSKSIDDRSENSMALTAGSERKRMRVTTRSEKPGQLPLLLILIPALYISSNIFRRTESSTSYSTCAQLLLY